MSEGLKEKDRSFQEEGILSTLVEMAGEEDAKR